MEEGIENINWTLISRRSNIWFCKEGNYENINNIKVSGNCKQRMLVLSIEDKEGFHMQVKTQRKWMETIPIIDLTSEKKEVIHAKDIKKFISKERKVEGPNLGLKAVQETKKKNLTKGRSKTPDMKSWEGIKVDNIDFGSHSDEERKERKSENLQRKAMDGLMERVDATLQEEKIIERPRGPRRKKEINKESYEKN
jgi:hypothetical protein